MGKRLVKQNTFVMILPFMVNDLELSGDQLMVYAIIYGFSQDGESHMTGGLSYMGNWIGKSKQNVLRAVNALVEKGFVKKYEKWDNGVKYCEYSIDPDAIPHTEQGCSTDGTGCSADGTGYSARGTGYSARGTGGIPPAERGYSARGTKKQYKEYTIKEGNKELNSKGKKSKFEPPSIEEIKEYCAERNNNIDPEYFFDYYQSNGWIVGKTKMKDWQSTIRTWERRGKMYANKNNQNGGNQNGNSNQNNGETVDYLGQWAEGRARYQREKENYVPNPVQLPDE